MTHATATMVPIDGITKDYVDPVTKQKKAVASLQIETHWATMQSFVTGALIVPATEDAFNERYGVFEQQTAVLGCVDALVKLQGMAKRFGDPVRFQASILNGEMDDTHDMPAYLFGQIIWVANKVANAADVYRSMNETIPQAFAAVSDVQARKDMLTDMLTGPQGLTKVAQEMKTIVHKFRVDHLLPFIADFEAIKPTVEQYAGESSTVYKKALENNKTLKGEIDKTTETLKDEWDKYRHYSIAAGTSAGVILIVSGGLLWPVSATAGGLLGGLGAEPARIAAVEQETILAKQQGELAKRTALVMDLAAMHAQLPRLLEGIKKVDDALGDIALVWEDQESALKSIVDTTPLKSAGGVVGVEDMSGLMAQMRVTKAANKWKQIGEDVRAFTSSAFTKPMTLKELAA